MPCFTCDHTFACFFYSFGKNTNILNYLIRGSFGNTASKRCKQQTRFLRDTTGRSDIPRVAERYSVLLKVVNLTIPKNQILHLLIKAKARSIECFYCRISSVLFATLELTQPCNHFQDFSFYNNGEETDSPFRAHFVLHKPETNNPATIVSYLTGVVRKPALCICENKDADQLRGNREADQRLWFSLHR